MKSNPFMSENRLSGTLLVSALLGGAVLGGCVESNSRTTVGDLMQPDLFAPRERPEQDVSLVADRATTVSLNRANWDPVKYEVPVDAIGYRPLYTMLPPGPDQTARQRLEYPTPASAVEGTRVGYWNQMGDSGIAFWYAFGDFFLLVPRVCLTQPWNKPQRLTPNPYWRGPVFEAREATWSLESARTPEAKRLE